MIQIQPYYYKAEYISKVNGEHFLNFDLGFRTWQIVSVTIENEEDFDLNPRDKLDVWVRVSNKTRHKPHKYQCRVVRSLDES